MTDGDTINLIWGVGAIMLVGSSLAARRLPLKQSFKMALAWVAIFAGVYVLFLFRGEARGIWQRATADLRGDSGTVSGGTLRIARGDDGHFHVLGVINGVELRFLVDSGATTTSLSRAAAAAAHVELSGGFPVALDTANGIATADRASAPALRVGTIEQRDPPLLVGDGIGDENLLGMSFLEQLKGWRVEDEILILQP